MKQVLQDSISKFKKGSRALTLLPAGDPDGCKGCPVAAECYAISIGKHRPSVPKKYRQRSKEVQPSALVRLAEYEIGHALMAEEDIPWFRWNPLGSSPSLSALKARKDEKQFFSAARALAETLNAANIPQHWPIQGAAKAKAYRKRLGDVVTIRESVGQIDDESQLNGNTAALRKHGARSVVAGSKGRGNAANAATAQAVADRATAKGIRCKVCPAALETFRVQATRPRQPARQSQKCGSCTACSDSQTELIIYPWHA